MLDHDDPYRYSCQDCSRRFKRNDHLKKHVESVHSQIKYACNFCDKKISRKDHLKRHIFNVHPSMVYNADTCGGTSVVERDSGPKTKPKRWYCEHCPEAFSRKDHVSRHVKAVHQHLTIPMQPMQIPFQPLQPPPT